MENNDINRIENRRQFLRNIARCGVVAGIGIAMAMFEYKRRRLLRQGKCVNRGICGDCSVLNDCRLPRALATKNNRINGNL